MSLQSFLPKFSLRPLGLVLVAALAIWPVSARAGEALLDRWYAALADVDRPAIAALLDEHAVVRLQDLGVTQTKAEFIASMDEWEEIASDANLAWRIDPDAEVSATEATALVCYRFTDNELLTRESFKFANARITESAQTTMGETCPGFQP